MNRPFIRLNVVTKIFETASVRVEALRSISLEITTGEMVVIAGPSGSGKSTLLNIMGGLDRPTTGEAVVDEMDLTSLDEHGLALYRRKSLGFLFQASNLIQGLSVLENVELPLLLTGEQKHLKEKALKMLGLVGLQDRTHSMPVTLSGGEQQRAALARALVHKPSIILADEPTANLDSHTAACIFELIKSLNTRLGATVIMATHDPLLIDQAQRVIHLHDGVVSKSHI